jgi:hypothetical protein
MTDLSPAAQAVLDAALDVDFCIEFPAALSPAFKASVQRVAATSIRAAADRVVPEGGVFLSTASAARIRSELLAIAAELEGQ